MKHFSIDGQRWAISQCGNFVKMYDYKTGEYTGWFALDMFNARFKAASKTAN